MVNDKFFNRYNQLKQMKQIDKKNKEYLEFFCENNYENEKIRKILNDQKICFERYFKCEEMALLFMEGLNPDNKNVEHLDKEYMLASCMNGFFVSLLCHTMIYYMDGTKKTAELRNVLIDSLINILNLENKSKLLESLSLYANYKMAFTFEQMGDFDNKIKNNILEWCMKRLKQLEREWNLLKDRTNEEKERELNKIWRDDSYISSYQLGMICSGGAKNIFSNENEPIIKEFEFWLLCRWLGNRIECNSTIFEYINVKIATKRMRELKEQVKDRNLRDILNFYCTNFSSVT